MSDERLKEIKDIMFTPHLDMYLSNICNELFQYVIKQKEVLDKIKNKLHNSKEYKMAIAMELNKEQSILIDILELLEEIE